MHNLALEEVSSLKVFELNVCMPFFFPQLYSYDLFLINKYLLDVKKLCTP